MPYQTRRVLVTVKAYPEISAKHGETVCVAGIDVDAGSWVRLYPIPFRDLEAYRKFKKYSIIEVRGTHPSNDNRPESFRIDQESIKIQEWLDTDKGKWTKRGRHVLPTVSRSLCEIQELQRATGKSLGVFKPKDVTFYWDKDEKAAKKSLRAKNEAAQQKLFDRPKRSLEAVPYRFAYRFKCANEPQCAGHDLTIVDWEVHESYRDWRAKYGEQVFDKLRETYEGRVCGANKDTYFYVGNMNKYRGSFLVLGMFWPSKIAS